jgi:multiple sugar transport system ATP-binding protein
MAEVRFEHVSKHYGENVPVIRDLNLTIVDHEFLVLVGPSGCGKSTALRMIAGLEEISEGDLYIGDRRVNDVAPKDRDLAMVFQNYALYPHMTVRDNMAFSLSLRHLAKPEIDSRVRKAADQLGLGPYLARKPRELSGGQRQRVALGRALVREPQVFLLDEPLSNLDAKLRVQTRTEIARLHQQTRTTFVYVTHDQVEAMTMGDRIAVLNAGVIQQLGAPQQLYDAPANLFVAGFIGSPAMNFFRAHMATTPQGDATLAIDGGSEVNPLTLPPAQAQRVRAQAGAESGQHVIVGVRPENLHVSGSEADPNTLSGVVDVVEHLGSEQLVYVKMPGLILPEAAAAARETDPAAQGTAFVPSATMRLDADVRVQAGQRIALAVDTTRLHLFDAATQERIA